MTVEEDPADQPRGPAAEGRRGVKSTARQKSRPRRTKNKVRKNIRMIEAKELLAMARSMWTTMRKKGTTRKMKLRKKRNPLNLQSRRRRR